MAKKPNPKTEARRTREAAELAKLHDLLRSPNGRDLHEVVKGVADEFHGQIPVFQSAVGALVLGQLYGWRVLRITHEPKTYAKYEKLLGVKFKEVCPEHGPFWERSVGYEWARKLGKFWEVVRGEVSVDNRRDASVIDSPPPSPVG